MAETKIAIITTNSAEAAPILYAVESLKRAGTAFNVCVRTADDLKNSGQDKFLQFAQASNMVLFHFQEEKTCFPDLDQLMNGLKDSGIPILVASAACPMNIELKKLSAVDQEAYLKITRYLNYGGVKNFENLLLYLANLLTGTSYAVEEPLTLPLQGLYHPDFKYLPTIDEYLEKKVTPGRITVGIWFHQNSWQSKNTSFVDSLINSIELRGANVIPVFFSSTCDSSLGIKGLEWIIETYFMKENKPLIDVVISTLPFSLSTSISGSQTTDELLKKLNVPIIKAVLTCNTFEQWHNAAEGLNVMELSSSVAMPEFDGILITVPIATLHFSEKDPSSGNRLIEFAPIPERIEKLVRLSLNWAKLKKIPNKDKRVALIFHNYPPRNDAIGEAFGLDSPCSVWNILRDLEKTGYHLDYLPKNGKEIIDQIINGLTNDRRWASEKELAQRAAAKISTEQYNQWYAELPLDVQEKMEQDWGKTPGKLFNYRDDLLVAGIINGNIFIGLQPPRGYLENPSSIYHDPDLAMPHHYYGYYRWIRDVFKANVIIHVGTHGSLEWLPGKAVGLSGSCSPDITISDLPNVYPYILNNPGEGTQAKRRSYCCIVDHLVPSMHTADSYEDIAKLEVHLQDYYHAKTSDREKLPYMQKLIWEKVCQANLDRDLQVNEEDVFSNFDAFLEKLHAYLHEVADTQIRDGLHILGEPPTDLSLDEFLVALTRLRNNSVPSLRESIAKMKNYDYEVLVANRGKLAPDGRTNGDIIKELNNLSLEVVKRFHEKGFQESVIDIVIADVLGAESADVKACLRYMSGFLVPSLASTTDELTHTLSGCDGSYIPPGPSGSPTRGMADILPTGRNFYSVDPHSIPTPAAWQVGITLCDALLERYLKEQGKYPESIGIYIRATDTMKTKGDDIAEILYLMGVIPVWEETGGRVVGLKAIPLEALKRPRIDVTLRITGLFRDTFPNLVHLIDEAVALVAGLKEPAEKNYVAKHVKTEVKEQTANGVDVERAREEACYRVFGDRPGAYGCGVSYAIDSKNWENQKDLADVYVTWGRYVFSRKNYGLPSAEQFKLRISKLDLPVVNIDTREYDIIDSDDWYDAHGGMILAVKTFTGKTPPAYCGDSSDPNRVKIRDTSEEIKHIFRSRILNPKWIQSMKRHGYHGAGDLSRTVDTVFGWDATAEVIDDWMYEDLARKYVFDADMQEWLKKVNPYALQNMTERLLEAIKRGMWDAAEETKNELQKIYLTVEGLLEGADEKAKETSIKRAE